MSKLANALLVAGVIASANVAMAQDVNSAARKDWGQFQTMLKKCEGMNGSAKEQCTADARAVYKASDFKCESLTGQDKTQCQTLAERWKKAPSAEGQDKKQDKDKQGSLEREGPYLADTSSQSDASGTDSKRRNRDSTQQQGPATPGPAAGGQSDRASNAPAVKGDEQSAGASPPANPGDPTDEMRNRDSRKQQGDAGTKLPEPTQKQN